MPKYLCVSTSFTSATLDMGGWLDLTQQGLSPCKKHQASLGALTSKLSRPEKRPYDKAERKVSSNDG